MSNDCRSTAQSVTINLLKNIPAEKVFKIAVVTNGKLNDSSGTPLWNYHISAMINDCNQITIIDPSFGNCTLKDWYAYLGVEFIEPSYFTTDVMYELTGKTCIYI
jgi:hypothetical protein